MALEVGQLNRLLERDAGRVAALRRKEREARKEHANLV